MKGREADTRARGNMHEAFRGTGKGGGQIPFTIQSNVRSGLLHPHVDPLLTVGTKITKKKMFKYYK